MTDPLDEFSRAYEEASKASDPFDGDTQASADVAGNILQSIDGGSMALFNRLPAKHRRIFLEKIAVPYLTGKDDDALKAVYAKDFERIPPSPKEYLDSPDYMGHYCKTELFPAWRPHLLHILDPANRVHETIFTGASGIGKTVVADLGLGYFATRLLCLRDAASYYGLAPRSKIYMGFYAYHKSMASEVGLYELRDVMIDPSPFFRDVYPRDPHGKEYIRWTNKRLEIIIGSDELHALGRALFAVVGDELNWFKRGDGTEDKARELVRELSRRLETRFVEEGGSIPGMAIYISQTRTTSDYLEQRIRDKRNNDGVYVVRGPRWAFNTLGYSRDKKRGFKQGDPSFRVFVGTETSDPRILDRVVRQPDGTFHIEKVEDEEGMEDSLVMDVPAVHYPAFVDDIHGSLRNLADVPTGAFTPFFPRRSVVQLMFDDTLPYPWNSQEIPCYEGMSTRLQDHFDYMMVTQIVMGRRRPIRNPGAVRYTHLDLSQGGDRTGFALVHPSGHAIVERPKDEIEEDGQGVGAAESVKTLECDFYVALVAGPHGEPIDYRKVRVFLHWLRRMGFPIVEANSDQYMSFDHLQRLRDDRFKAEVVSTDKNSRAYRALRQAANETRVRVPFPTGVVERARLELMADEMRGVEGIVDPRTRALSRVILYNELTGLEYDVKRDKVDHRNTNPDGSKGSKDIADALAGASFRCLIDDEIGPEASRAYSTVTQESFTERYNRYLSQVNF